MKYIVKLDDRIIGTIELDDTSDEAIESACNDLGLEEIVRTECDFDGHCGADSSINQEGGVIQYDIVCWRSDSAAAKFTIEPVESSQS